MNIFVYKNYFIKLGVYGSYLLACYNEDMECYETICKAGIIKFKI